MIKIPGQMILYFIIIAVAAAGLAFLLLVPPPAGFYTFLIVAALGGLAVSANVWYTKAKQLKLVCPTGSDCNAVVTSRYSKFLGIKLEYMGVLYFLIIIAIYLAFILNPAWLEARTMVAGVVMLTVAAGLFSLYLLFVQAFLLRQWCIWCILAAILSLTIFFISFISLPAWVAYLTDWQLALLWLQFLGYAWGLGATTAGVFLFLNHFLADRNIDDKEFDTLKSFTELVWVGFGLVLLMQLTAVVINPAVLASGTFLAGLIALVISGIAGAIIMVILSPYIVVIPFDKSHHTSWLAKLRQPLFIFGALGLAGWYFTFTTHFLPDWPAEIMLAALILVLIIAVILSLLLESYLTGQTDNNETVRPD